MNDTDNQTQATDASVQDVAQQATQETTQETAQAAPTEAAQEQAPVVDAVETAAPVVAEAAIAPVATEAADAAQEAAQAAEQQAAWPEVARPERFVIAPTVGRKVHFYPNGQQFHSEPKAIDSETPMDADVVYVWGDSMVNLTVRDHIGQVHAFTSITLRQPDDAKPAFAYAEWMPFQAEQARAAAQAQAQVG